MKFPEVVPAGTVVRVPKDTPVYRTTAPESIRRKTIGRTTKVKIDHSFPAYESSYSGPRPATITWAGKGGYWVTVVATDEILATVELLNG